MNFSFVFNSQKSRKKRKRLIYRQSERKLRVFFGMSPLSMVSKCAKVSKICPLKL